MSGRPALTLLSRPDCHLCHEMRAVVERVLHGRDAALVEKDIQQDLSLSRRYALAIPVLLYGETEIARHRIGEEELRERLARAGWPPPA